MNEDTLEQGDGHYYDYCSEIDEEERKFHIANLIESHCPKGCSPLWQKTQSDQWRCGQVEKEFVTAIQEKAQAVTVENCMMCIGAVYQLEKFLKNPLDLGYQFYMDEYGVNGYAEQSYSFLQTVSQFEPGKLLYIGGVIDYHF